MKLRMPETANLQRNLSSLLLKQPTVVAVTMLLETEFHVFMTRFVKKGYREWKKVGGFLSFMRSPLVKQSVKC